MKRKRGILPKLLKLGNDHNFLKIVEVIEAIASKVLSIALLIVILVTLVDLIVVLFQSLFASPIGLFNTKIIEVFGLFLNILIALELLENVTAYLRKHGFHVELVIATSLIAVARKIIIFDLNKYSSVDLIAFSRKSKIAAGNCVFLLENSLLGLISDWILKDGDVLMMRPLTVDDRVFCTTKPLGL